MPVPVIARTQWGAKSWQTKTYSVPLKERTEFFVHYHGSPPTQPRGYSVPRNIEGIHVGNGWAGIGYNFMVDQDGVVYEGRGWSLVGAHCPGHNRSGIGVYVAVGGDQRPSDKALRAVRALYDEACGKTGRKLAMRGHRDGRNTACPGDALYAWVKAGMPTTALDGEEQDDIAFSERPLLREGSAGRHVEALQQALADLGYSIVVDGDFGPATADDVKDFQAKHDLEVDGIAGPNTYAALDKATAPAPKEKATKAKPTKAKPKAKELEDRHLGLADPLLRGQDVKNVQHALNVYGFELEEDGIYGRKTADAVNEFNAANDIDVAGCGPETWAALRLLVHG